MELTNKARAQRLANELQASTSREAQAARELVGLLLDDVKHNLVSAQGDGLLRKQGEAQMLQRLQSMLTDPPPQLDRE